MSQSVSTVTAPEFVEVADCKTGFGLGKNLVYDLLKTGKIRSVNVRREGCVRGKRLIEVASVREYLNSFSGEIDPLLSERLRKVRAGRGKSEQ